MSENQNPFMVTTVTTKPAEGSASIHYEIFNELTNSNRTWKLTAYQCKLLVQMLQKVLYDDYKPWVKKPKGKALCKNAHKALLKAYMDRLADSAMYDEATLVADVLTLISPTTFINA